MRAKIVRTRRKTAPLETMLAPAHRADADGAVAGIREMADADRDIDAFVDDIDDAIEEHRPYRHGGMGGQEFRDDRQHIHIER